jgi:hypothetical protein
MFVAADRILELLLGCVRVDRGHEAGFDPELVQQDLGHRADRVGGARGVGDDVVPLGVVGVVVDAEDDRQVGVGRRRGDDHLVRAGFEVLRRSLPVREQPGRLDDHVYVHVLPGQRRGIPLRQHPEGLVVDRDLAFRRCNLVVEDAVRRVVAEEMREDVRGREVVDRDDLEPRVAVKVGAVKVTSDPPEAVDPDPFRHGPPRRWSKGDSNRQKSLAFSAGFRHTCCKAGPCSSGGGYRPRPPSRS